MRRRRPLSLQLATAVLVGLGYLSLMTTFRYGFELVIVPVTALVAMPVGEWLDRRTRVYRYVTTGAIYLYLALFFAILGRFSFLDAVLSLVMFIQVYLLVHEKRPRHYAYIALMSFFLLWAAITESPRPDIAFVVVPYVFAMVWALGALERFAAQTSVTDAGRAPAPVKVRSLREGVQEAAGARLSLGPALMACAALALGAMLFAFGPRTEAGVFGANPVRVQPTTGVSSEIDFFSSGALQADTTPVMRVQFPDAQDGRFNGPMLWRVTALDRYTGVGWEHSGLVTTPPRRGSDSELYRFMSDWRAPSREGVDRVADDRWPLVRQEIYLDRPPETAVPALQMVKRVVAMGNSTDFGFRWDVAGDFSVVMASRNDSGFDIEVLSEWINPRPDDLRDADTNYRALIEPRDLQTLTAHNLLPETVALAQRLTDEALTVYDKVQALVRYLSGPDFLYTTIIPALPAQNPIDAFILDIREGHCELYASSLALMVRSLGVPARLVTGYRDGIWDPNDRSYTVTKDTAHLWAEVYFPGYGWISFDPSPQGDIDLAIMDSMARRVGVYLLRARILWLRYVVGFRPSERQVVTDSSLAEILRWGDDSGPVRREDDGQSQWAAMGRTAALLVLPAALIAGLAYVLWRRGPARAGRGARLTDDQLRAVRLRGAIVQAFRRWGITCEGKTAEELAEAVASLRTNDPAAAWAILTAYNETRFGNRPMTAEQYASWRRRLRSVYRVPDET